MALMFHKYEFSGASKPIGNGIYVGALKEAREALEARVEVSIPAILSSYSTMWSGRLVH